MHDSNTKKYSARGVMVGLIKMSFYARLRYKHDGQVDRLVCKSSRVKIRAMCVALRHLRESCAVCN